MNNEIWRPVPVAWVTGYEVSNMGRIKSLPRFVAIFEDKQRWCRGGFPKLKVADDGHLYFRFWNGEKQIKFWVHSLVAEAFIGPCPDGLEVCHNDGNPKNNSVTNLRYDTHRNNGLDASKHGSYAGRDGEGNSRARLKTADVLEMRKEAASGTATKVLAERYGIQASSVRNILRRRNWKHV